MGFTKVALVWVMGYAGILQGSQVSLSHVDVLKKLEQGNFRFSTGVAQHPDQTLARVREVSHGHLQQPFAAVLGCADSRVPPEIVFDQGVGDLFTVREAGNIVDDDVLGSLEYAVEYLHVPLVLVLGHQECGAVEAALKHEAHGHIGSIIKKIEPAIANLAEKNPALLLEKAVLANVERSVKLLTESGPILSEKIKRGELKIAGAIYATETGKVTFLH